MPTPPATAPQPEPTRPSAPRPTWRGRLHAWAFFCVPPAGLALLVAAQGAAARTAAAIYLVTLAALFGCSAAYHRLATTPRARRIMRRVDHSMIYLLIAGTYTPLCLVTLPKAWGLPLLGVVWGGAAAGITLKLVGFHRFRHAANFLYILLGWAAVAALPAIVGRLSAAELALMVAGGVAYTAGSVILLRRRPDPSPLVFGYHELWHACTVAAGICHFALVWLLTSSAGSPA
ncbi:MAG: hemolysin III family protein [Acidimicrobiales bacterium]